MNSKEYFFNEVIKEVNGGDIQKPVRVLELGCGTAPYVEALIVKYPNLEYVGVEPIEASFKKAQHNLRNIERTQVRFQLGYDAIEGVTDESFDIVISFSVLEHVKQLGRFLDMSARYMKKGGVMVHRYDLGHALYPTTAKEHLHVWLGNTIPAVLPERTFVRYVPMIEVSQHYKRLLGSLPYKYTYHQMPNHKSLDKALHAQKLDTALMEEVYAWEFAHAHLFSKLSIQQREKLFPSVAVWGKKSL